MIPENLKKMFGLNSEKDEKMANNIWKMLDEMAQSSPQNYKQFVQKNIKQGVQDVKTKKQQKQKPFKIKPSKGFLLQFDVTLNQKVLTQTAQQKNERLQQKLDISKQKWQEIKKKFNKKLGIILNVCHSDRVKFSIDKNKKQIRNVTLSNIRDIQIFYYSLQGPSQVKSKDNVNQYDYCMIINTQMYQSLIKQTQGKKLLMGLCLSYFQQRLQNDHNPLIKLYNPNLYQKLAFYAVEKSSIQINSSKSYFYNGSLDVQQFLLERQVDIKRQKEVKQEQEKVKSKLKQQTKIPDIKFRQQNVQQSVFKNQQTKNKQRQRQTAILSSASSSSKKKPLIEVLNQTQVSLNQTQGIQNRSVQFPFELKQSQQGYHIQILTPGIKDFSQLDLEINSNFIKLKTIKKEHLIQIGLNTHINIDTVKAKYKKKLNRLVIDAQYLNKKI